MLIEICAEQNPEIRNKQKVTVYQIRIAGVMNAGQGKPNGSAQKVRKLVGRS